ncbi:hypothetical protein RP20_CCG016260 [Aedes albopictus]|nr:hypothetical protein RP20_CCG016260 [Aedes albopictus]
MHCTAASSTKHQNGQSLPPDDWRRHLLTHCRNYDCTTNEDTVDNSAANHSYNKHKTTYDGDDGDNNNNNNDNGNGR